MTMVTPSGLREEILPRISDCACAEKPRPPCSLEMSMPRKPWSRTKCQMSSGTSCSSWRMCQSLSLRQSSSVGPSRKARSSAVSVIGATRRSFVPVGRAGEELGVPADRAGFERLALGVGDGRHGAFKRAIGGQHDVVALDVGEGRANRTAGGKPAEQRPEWKHRPMEMAVRQAHLQAQGEDGGRQAAQARSGARFMARANNARIQRAQR